MGQNALLLALPKRQPLTVEGGRLYTRFRVDDEAVPGIRWLIRGGRDVQQKSHFPPFKFIRGPKRQAIDKNRLPHLTEKSELSEDKPSILLRTLRAPENKTSFI